MPSASTFADDYVALLTDRTFAGRHPSPAMLDRIEHAIYDRASAERYLDQLLDLLEQQRYPSHHFLTRITRMIRLLSLLDEEP
jgi:hypothetical protein